RAGIDAQVVVVGFYLQTSRRYHIGHRCGAQYQTDAVDVDVVGGGVGLLNVNVGRGGDGGNRRKGAGVPRPGSVDGLAGEAVGVIGGRSGTWGILVVANVYGRRGASVTPHPQAQGVLGGGLEDRAVRDASAVRGAGRHQ